MDEVIAVKVTMTWAEAEQAAIAGIKRRLLALHDGRPAYHGFKEEDTWGSDVESCASELIVARTLGVWWTPWARRPGFVFADVGSRVQVRRRKKEGWNLLMHREDSDDQVYVLVYGAIPNFEIVGWIAGHEGKDERYWGDPYSTGRPCFWIPQVDLNPDIMAISEP